LCVKDGWYVVAGLSPKKGGGQVPLLSRNGSLGTLCAEISPAASGGRIVEPITEEDFRCAA
jgi:hypothetical protein